MIALVRSLAQLFVARLLATGAGAALFEILSDAGISESQLVDYATIVTFGIVVELGRILRKLPAGAKLAEWWNLVISAGRSRFEPEYQPKHLATDPDHQTG